MLLQEKIGVDPGINSSLRRKHNASGFEGKFMWRLVIRYNIMYFCGNIYIYIYTRMCVCIYVYIYIYEYIYDSIRTDTIRIKYNIT